MSTCAVCLKPFDPYTKPHLYRQTMGHNACGNLTLGLELLAVKRQVLELEEANAELEIELKDFQDTMLDEERPDELDPEDAPMEIM